MLRFLPFYEPHSVRRPVRPAARGIVVNSVLRPFANVVGMAVERSSPLHESVSMGSNVFSLNSIGKKFAVAFGIALFAVCVMSLVAVLQQRQATAAAAASGRALRAIDDVDQVLANLYDQNASVRGLSLYKETRFVGKFETAGQRLAAALAAAKDQLAGNEASLPGLAAVATSVQAWQDQIGTPSVRLAGDPATRDASVALTASAHASELINAFRDVCTKLQREPRSTGDGIPKPQEAAGAALLQALAIGTVSVLLIMLATWLWMTRDVVRPGRPDDARHAGARRWRHFRCGAGPGTARRGRPDGRHRAGLQGRGDPCPGAGSRGRPGPPDRR